MPIRLHLSSADIARVRLAPGPSAMEELNGVVLRVRSGSTSASSVAECYPGLDLGKFAMVAGVTGYIGCEPGFMCLPGSDVDEVADGLLGRPVRTYVEDLTDVATTGHRPPAWTGALAYRDLRPRLELVAAVQHVYRRLVEPAAARSAHAAAADRRVRAEQLAEGGVDALLAGLNPRISWDGATLSADLASGPDFDVELDGVGVQLTPTIEGNVSVSNSAASDGAMYVSYPIAELADSSPVDDALGAVLGTFRAAALAYLRAFPGAGTRQLARAVGVAPSTASEHLTAMRAAGLITTSRNGRAVAHQLTAVGAGLVG